MARAESHIDLANKNHEALVYMLAAYEQLPEWVTTIAFYKAVQIVDALCMDIRSRAPTGHPDRLEWLQRMPEFQPLYPHFRTMHAASCIARYLSDKGSRQAFSSFSDFLKPNEVIELLKKRLIPIEQYSISKFRTDSLKKLLRQTDPKSLPTAEPRSESAVTVSKSVAASPAT